MRDELLGVLRKYLSSNRGGPHYGILVDEVSPDQHTVTLTLTFMSGVQYCCAEPGCHFGLMDSRSWQRLHGLIEEAGLKMPSPLTVVLRGVVEQGARLTVMRQFGLPEEQEAYEYEHEYVEPGN